MSNLQFRQPVMTDAERCYQIEVSAYEGDEAATLEKIRTRISQYPQASCCSKSRAASWDSSTAAVPMPW